QEQLQSLKNKVTSFCSLCHLCLSDPDAGVQEKAFTVLSDLLVIFGPQLPRDGRDALAPLVVQPEADLQSQLAAFLMDHVFYGDQEELSSTEDTERHVVELPQRRVFLAGFCKLIIYNVLELSAASDVFKHYAKFHSDYGDIIKEMLSLTRNMDLQEWGRTLLLSLKQLMTELLLQEGPDIQDTKGFQEIRDLARRFSPLFSFHQLQNRRVLVDLHKEGIEFAFQDGPKHRRGLPPLNLPFLEVLSEFSSRLLSPDK
ncbi:STAG3 protein, partial [Jacana jacana]|nr:STAG3 protein [Jacana jacana]